MTQVRVTSRKRLEQYFRVKYLNLFGFHATVAQLCYCYCFILGTQSSRALGFQSQGSVPTEDDSHYTTIILIILSQIKICIDHNNRQHSAVARPGHGLGHMASPLYHFVKCANRELLNCSKRVKLHSRPRPICMWGKLAFFKL